MNANVSVHSSLNCRFSLYTFLLAVNLEQAVFVQSRLQQPVGLYIFGLLAHNK